ncbi:helix-turn-helix transcriptional regulator [Dietzia sp.]|uniref:helix-turn-helix transcriptional regulator n=1 Tax=Dietzia sp. TaxID=1871616 RepID=UPI002FDB07AF
MYSSPALSPGVLLRTELDAREWTVEEFAGKIGVAPDRAREFLNDHSPYDNDTGHRIAETFGSSEDLWLKLQRRYQRWQDMAHEEA